MFSAKSGGQVYIAGSIDEPKSRKYTCPTCGEEVSHVSETKRSLNIIVSEHFRHRAGEAKHPHKKFTWQVGNIMRALLENFSDKTGLEQYFGIETDRRFTASIEGRNLDFVVDMLATEKGLDHRKTAIIVESEGFNANELLRQLHLLSSQGIYSMLVLSAKGRSNPSGNYFRPEYRRHTRKTVTKIPGNEKAVYELFGERNIYFDHDAQSLMAVRFDDYSEEHDEERQLDTGHVIPAGTQEFETKKLPEILLKLKAFGIEYLRTSPGGLLIARPLSIVDYYLDLEKRAEAKHDEGLGETVGERIGIMLDSMGTEERARLTEKYGVEKLGGYAVERQSS
jgi:hypothetical protein